MRGAGGVTAKPRSSPDGLMRTLRGEIVHFIARFHREGRFYVKRDFVGKTRRFTPLDKYPKSDYNISTQKSDFGYSEVNV